MKNKEVNIDVDEKIYNFFLKLEERLQLLNGESEISTIWERIRQQTSEDIKALIFYKDVNYSEINHITDRTMFDKFQFLLTTVLKLVANSVYKNPFFTLKKPYYLFFSNSRRILSEDGTYCDIYTEPLREELCVKNTMSIEHPWNFQHYGPKSVRDVKYGDFLLLMTYILGVLNLQILKRDTRNILEVIEAEIFKNFSVKVKLKAKAFKTINKRNGVLSVYRILFKWLRPKIIFYISLNTDLAVIEAAHLENITVVELQHGVLNLYTKFPETSKIKSIPDYYFTFGKYWTENSNLPIDAKRTIAVGFPFLAKGKKNYIETQKLDQVVFISQCSKELERTALLLANSPVRPKNILFKLRKSEFNDWKQYYPELNIANNKKILKVIENDSTLIYKMLAESKYQVGISSMLLFEGIAFGCMTIILKTSDYKYSSFLVSNNLAIYAEPGLPIDLTKAPNINSCVNNLFNNEWEIEFKNALKKIEKDKVASTY
jgi:hypothetical protein